MESIMNNRSNTAVAVDIAQKVYALQHMESGEFICLLQDGVDYLACFSNGDNALQFREELGLQEHVSLFVSSINACPFKHFWLDGSDMVLEN
jgi:hypothetical protein